VRNALLLTTTPSKLTRNLDKKPKKAAKDEDEDDVAFKAKQAAGTLYPALIHQARPH